MNFEDTITHGYQYAADEYTPAHKSDTRSDLEAARGIILASLIGANVVIWIYIAIALRWFS